MLKRTPINLMDIDRIIDIVRSLKEEALASAPGPTMSMSKGAIAGSVEAGDDPPVRKKKRYIYAGKGSRKQWMA